jgi:hypothetical protein
VFGITGFAATAELKMFDETAAGRAESTATTFTATVFELPATNGIAPVSVESSAVLVAFEQTGFISRTGTDSFLRRTVRGFVDGVVVAILAATPGINAAVRASAPFIEVVAIPVAAAGINGSASTSALSELEAGTEAAVHDAAKEFLFDRIWCPVEGSVDIGGLTGTASELTADKLDPELISVGPGVP